MLNMSHFHLPGWIERTEFPTWAVIACGSAACGIVVLYFIQKHRHSVSSQKNQYLKDTVVLHQIGRGPNTPSLTPFAVKLETYLRMAKIPYQNVHDFVPSSKNKFPWIEYNGKAVADSQFAIEFVNKTKGVDLNSHLSGEDRAIARAFQKMLEENTYWTLLFYRWFVDDLATIKNNLRFGSYLRIWFIRRYVRAQVYGQGMGRHTEEEVYSILTADLGAVSTFLGKKKFLFGDQPCETDCAVFGMLTVPCYASFGGRYGTAIKKFPNLCDYCERMKAKYWPDWDECTTHGWTREATK